jgi:hypothetical protein
MAAKDPEKPPQNDEAFDDLLANYRGAPPRRQPKIQAHAQGESDAAYAHGPRTPIKVVDTLPIEPPVVLNITQPLQTVPRPLEPTEPPAPKPASDVDTFPIPEVRVRRLRARMTIAAVVALGLLAFGIFVRWRTLSQSAAVEPAATTSASVTAAASPPMMPVDTSPTPLPEPTAAEPPATARVPVAPPTMSNSAPAAAAPPKAASSPRAPTASPPPVPTTTSPVAATATPPAPPTAPTPPPAKTAKPKDDVSRTF